MWENLWEEVKENHNKIISKISEYNYIIKNGNFLEHPIELDVTVYYNLLMSHIIILLSEDDSLYLTENIFSVLSLDKSDILPMVDWTIDGNKIRATKNNNVKLLNNLFDLCFNKKCEMFIQEICAQDIVNHNTLAEEISSIFNFIFFAITYDSKGEEEILNILAVNRKGVVKKINIRSKYDNEYKKIGSLIYNRVFKHNYVSQKHFEKVTLTNNEDGLNYKNDNMYCQTAVLHIGVEKTNSSGTAFLISEDGYALTCAHVVAGAEEVVANVITGDGYLVQGFEDLGIYDIPRFWKVVYVNNELDIALLKEEDFHHDFLSVEQGYLLPEMGEEVVVFGYPLGYEMPKTNAFGPNISFYRGYVSSNQVKDGNSVTFLDIDVKSGNSGSPVISTKTGKVIGIISGVKVGGNMILKEKMPYMIPIQHFLELNK